MLEAAKGKAAIFLRDVVLQYDGDECLTWPHAKDRSGYARIGIAGKGCQVSRIACEYANGSPPSSKHEAAHSCGNGNTGCVTKSHLRWATRQENEADKRKNGRAPTSGENCSFAKLAEADVLNILSLRGRTQKELAAEFGVKRNTISRILSGKRWAHLSPPSRPHTA